MSRIRKSAASRAKIRSRKSELPRTQSLLDTVARAVAGSAGMYIAYKRVQQDVARAPVSRPVLEAQRAANPSCPRIAAGLASLDVIGEQAQALLRYAITGERRE